MKKAFYPLVIPALVLMSFATYSIGADNKDAKEKQRKIKKAIPKDILAQPKQDRKVLVFSQTNGFHHPSIATGQDAMRILGKKTGAFEATVSNDLSNFEEDTLKEFDAVVFLNTTGSVFLPHPKEFEQLSDEEKSKAKETEQRLQKNLMAFVKGGKGFIGIHAATDTYYSWPEYGEMINGYFWGHPWTAGMDVVIDVEKGQEEHPLVAMLEGKSLEFKEEIYQLKDPYDSSKVHMLLRLNTEESQKPEKGIRRTDDDFGVSWIRPWGDGRVFYCSIGHNHAMYWHEKVLEHYLAGIQWALGDLEVPVEIN